MLDRRISPLKSILSALWIGLVLIGCLPEAPKTQPETGVFSIDPLFREFYASLGGRNVLGPTITALFYKGNDQCQYTQNALMCFTTRTSGVGRHFLYSLGMQMGLSGPDPAAQPAFEVYEEFAPLYQELNKLVDVGQPLSQARYNSNRNRIEQYFENAGFYRNIDAPYGQVQLLAYGVYGCGGDCRFTPPESAVVVPSPAAVEQPFLAQLVRLGGLTVFGVPLTGPYTTADGSLEQVYENVVMVAPSGDPTNMRLRSLALLLNKPQSALVPQSTDAPAEVVFYAVNNNLGHYVLTEFDHFIASHGGPEISGTPLEEVEPQADGTLRQCFENYCLTYASGSAVNERIRMEPLGRDYMLAYNIQPYETAPFLITNDTVTVTVMAANPRLPADQGQTFEVIVKYTATQQPVANVNASLTLTLPGGQQALYSLPPTDAHGRTSLTIGPLQPAPDNGKVISFQTCLEGSSDQPVCAAETYLIWNYQ